MQNPRLAIRYAKSLLDLAQEQNKLEFVYDDMQLLDNICKTNREFANILKSPIIKEDKKNQIIESVTAGKINVLTASFIKLLGTKSRESNLPEIISAFIDQYNIVKGIHKAKLTTAVELSAEMKNTFINKIKSSEGIKNIELETVVNENLVGGFVLEMEGKKADASIRRDLMDVQKQFMNNDYIQKLR
ncbi:MAG: ATP synthase F1 subunit delta [Bacteroidota bacterium]|nr:ATP synthase F1 subunit delta [Bacteroidota bacterium]